MIPTSFETGYMLVDSGMRTMKRHVFVVVRDVYHEAIGYGWLHVQWSGRSVYLVTER